MATIRPFQGLRYTAKAGNLLNLVAPPYDVMSPAERDGYAVRSPHNVVHLTVPESREGDRSKFVKYARSAAALAEWRRDEFIAAEDKPAIYRYTQTFTLKGAPDKFTRTSFIALIKTEPYENGVVLPHEETFPKHKEDRLRILEATRAHLECIFGLYEDPGSSILNTLKGAEVGTAVSVGSDDHVHQTLEPITSPEAIRTLVEHMRDKKVWIADGHHRYETARAFRDAQGKQDGPVAEDFMMMAFSSMSDPGLVLLPTHRVVTHLPHDHKSSLERLGWHFNIHETHASRLIAEIGKHSGPAFGLAFEGGIGYVLTVKDIDAIHQMAGDSGSDALRALDVTILHRVIFEQILDVKGLESMRYTRDSAEALTWVNEGADAAFLMNPPSVEDMRVIANGGEVMPQKSTYYFPKILSGLVLWSLNDF